MFCFSRCLRNAQLRNYTSNYELHKKLLNDVLPLIDNYMKSALTKKVINFHTPQELKNNMNFTLPDHGTYDVKDIVNMIDNTFKYSVNTQSPLFMDKLYAGS